jgi:hypothetical protein
LLVQLLSFWAVPPYAFIIRSTTTSAASGDIKEIGTHSDLNSATEKLRDFTVQNTDFAVNITNTPKKTWSNSLRYINI